MEWNVGALAPRDAAVCRECSTLISHRVAQFDIPPPSSARAASATGHRSLAIEARPVALTITASFRNDVCMCSDPSLFFSSLCKPVLRVLYKGKSLNDIYKDKCNLHFEPSLLGAAQESRVSSVGLTRGQK